MIDLNKIVNDSMEQIEKEGFVEKIVKERLEKTISDIVDDTFRSWSDFGKNLKTHIEENLNVNLEKLSIDAYNTLVLKAVQEKLDNAMKVQGIEKIKEAMDNMLKDVKDEYKLSELIEELKKEDYRDEWEYDEDDQITLIIDGRGLTWISLDEDGETSEYSCKYRLTLNENGQMISLKIDDREIDKKSIMAGFNGLGDILFKIYASGAKIVLDCGDNPEDYELYYREDY